MFTREDVKMILVCPFQEKNKISQTDQKHSHEGMIFQNSALPSCSKNGIKKVVFPSSRAKG